MSSSQDAWSQADLVEKLLVPALGGLPLKVRETLILHVRDGENELGRLFLVHGHQGTLDNDYESDKEEPSAYHFGQGRIWNEEIQ